MVLSEKRNEDECHVNGRANSNPLSGLMYIFPSILQTALLG
jgi:hypothetical protein